MIWMNPIYRMLGALVGTVLALAAFPAPPAQAAPGPYYVRTDGNDANGGLSWTAAKKTIQAAVDATTESHQVWVAQGTYHERINIKTDVLLYGGFRGDEANLDSRVLGAAATTIDGDYLNYQPAITLTVQNQAIIDGFRIIRGCSGINASSPSFTFANNCSLTISNCLIENNNGMVGGGLKIETIGSLLISRCKIRLNGGSLQGGGLYLHHCSGRILDCEIVGNSAHMGGGLWIQPIYLDTLQMERCLIGANSSGGQGGGFYIIDTPSYKNDALTVTDSLICANNAPDGAAFYLTRDGAAPGQNTITLNLRQCTVADNEGTQDTSGTLSLSPSTSLNLTNSILASRTALLIDNGRLSARNCLFQPSAAGILRQDASQIAWLPKGTPLVYQGAPALNTVAGFTGNIQGDPGFVGDSPAATRGTWTAPAVFDDKTYRTTLVDAAAHFTPGALAGRMIRPFEDSGITAIADNTATAIVLHGHWETPSATGRSYRFLDYHLATGSQALDRGSLADATPTDFEGEGRPGGDGLVDIGADEAPAGLTPPPLPALPDSTPPVSRVDALPAFFPISTTIGVHAFDSGSGVGRARLYYRFERSGDWHLYDTVITAFTGLAGQVVFDAGRANGAGEYEFYAVAIDKTGNAEAKSPGVEARATVGPVPPANNIIRYLLGRSTNPAGLDANGDGRINIGDVLTRNASFTPVRVAPAGGRVMTLQPTLSWVTAAPASAGARTYDLYLWPAAQPRPTTPTASGLTASSWWAYPALNRVTPYNWQVVTRVGFWERPGPVWSFQTGNLP